MLIAGGAAVLVTRERARFAGLGNSESAPAPPASARAPRREDRAAIGQEPPGTPENRGLALARVGALDDAAAAFRRALALDSRRPDVWNNLGVVLIRAGDVDGGLAAFREALALSPTDPEANRNLAVALDRRGELGEARRHYRAFLAAAAPDHPNRDEVARRVAALGAGGTGR
jgi:Flp pilus assembly protein TadD